MLKNLYALGISVGVSMASLGIAMSASASHCSTPNDCEQASLQRHYKAVPSQGRTSHKWLLSQTHLHTAQAAKLPTLPASIDLRFNPNTQVPNPNMPAVYDQGQLGSCTANAFAGAMQYAALKQQTRKTASVPSRLAIYYGERQIEGTVDQDSGASLSDGLMFLHTTGACPETTWPYADDSVTFTTQPSVLCYTQARCNMELTHAFVPQSLSGIQTALTNSLPVIFGLLLYQSFESLQTAQSGIVNMPQPGETLLGGHAALIVGYNNKQQRFIVRNSWGTGWGQKGYFTIPYQYVLSSDLAFDFYTISKVGLGQAGCPL